MNKFLITLLTCLPMLGMSQAIEMINYDWDKNAAIHTLTADEQKEPAVILNDDRIIEYYWNKNDEAEEYLTRHRIVHLNENKAVEDFNKIYVPVLAPSYLINFKARSISKNGTVKEMLRGEMKEVVEKGTRYMSLAIDGLEKGSELEYYYTLKRSTSWIGTEYLQSGILVRNSLIKIITPENIVMACKSYNGGPAFTDTIIAKKRYKIANAENIQPSYEEKYSSRDACLMRVEFKVLKNLRRGDGILLTYADGGKNIYNNLNNIEKGEQKDIEKIVSKLDLKGKTTEEKARAIEGWVKTNIDIKEGVDVKDLSEVIKTGIAGKMEMEKLCVGMMKAAQVKFEIVVTISHLDKNFDPDFESWSYLDDIFFYLPELDTYLVPTNFGARLGLLPDGYIGNSALFIKEVSIGDISSAVTSVKKLPVPGVEVSHDNMDISVQFPASDKSGLNQVNQHTHRSMTGYVASGVRPYYFYSPEDKKKEMIEDMLKSEIDGAKITNMKVKNFNLNTKEVMNDFIMDADISYSSLIEKVESTYLFKVGAVIGRQIEMYQEKPRQKPMAMNFLHSEDRHITITIPEGYTAKGLDALNMNVTGGGTDKPNMGFISSYTLKGNTIEVNIHEFYEGMSYPAAYYENFRKVINASADFNKVTIVFEKKG